MELSFNPPLSLSPTPINAHRGQNKLGGAAGGNAENASNFVGELRAELEIARADRQRDASEAKEKLEDTTEKFNARLDKLSQKKKEAEERVAELEPEVARLTDRCRELTQASELTGEVRVRLFEPMIR